MGLAVSDAPFGRTLTVRPGTAVPAWRIKGHASMLAGTFCLWRLRHCLVPCVTL